MGALSDALAAIADRWVPELFPHGRIVDGVMRCADISGAAPRKEGSCHIQLRGDHAGSWFDHSLGKGGGPLSTIKERLGLTGGDLIKEAQRVLTDTGVSLDRHKPRPRAQAAPRYSDSDTAKSDAAFALSKIRSIAGTLGEKYLVGVRGITRIPQTDDLGFSDDVTNFKTRRGQDALVARFRFPDGTPTGGAHRIYLNPDGTKDQRKMVGPCDGGVIMLAPIDAEGRLGVAEGVETTLSAMQLYGIPGWAAGSDGNIKKFGEWLTAEPGRAEQIGLKTLSIWADRGNAGVTAAQELLKAARSVGVDADIYLPRGDDDFNDDLMNGRPAAEPMKDEPTSLEPIEGDVLPSAEDVKAAIAALAVQNEPQDVLAVLRLIAEARLDPLHDKKFLKDIKRHSDSDMPELKAALKTARRLLQKTSAQAATGTAVRSWRENLHLTDKGEVRPIAANVFRAIYDNPFWAGVIALNEFSGLITLRAKPPWTEPNFKPRPWTDEDTRLAMLWVQDVDQIFAKTDVVFEAIAIVAERNKFHPVREYFGGLKEWDGVERLARVPEVCFGREGTPYTREVFKRWAIGAVARVMQPGCKSDSAIILEGPQGIGKSTALRALAVRDEWFTDQIPDLGSKDAAMQIRGIWILEMAELDSMNRSDISATKAFLSRTEDRFRPPYGKMPINVKRQVVFAGSVNDEEYLRDPTGGRRWWPLKCTKFDLKKLSERVDQLWTEALYLYQAGKAWYLDDPDVIELAKAEQSDRYISDAWETVIAKHLKETTGKNSFTVSEILEGALKIYDTAKWDRSAQTRVGVAMKQIGWTRLRDKTGDREWRYWRPDYEPKEAEG